VTRRGRCELLLWCAPVPTVAAVLCPAPVRRALQQPAKGLATGTETPAAPAPDLGAEAGHQDALLAELEVGDFVTTHGRLSEDGWGQVQPLALGALGKKHGEEERLKLWRQRGGTGLLRLASKFVTEPGWIENARKVPMLSPRGWAAGRLGGWVAALWPAKGAADACPPRLTHFDRWRRREQVVRGRANKLRTLDELAASVAEPVEGLESENVEREGGRAAELLHDYLRGVALSVPVGKPEQQVSGAQAGQTEGGCSRCIPS
jgi:hypothetical protein